MAYKIKISSLLVTIFILLSCEKNITEISVKEPIIEKSINIINPKFNEEYLTTDTVQISWEIKNIEKINIFVLTDIGQKGIIVSNFNADEYNYDWVIPSWGSSGLRIIIADYNDSTICDTSDYFYISPKKILELTYPNSGGEYYYGDTLNITWESLNVYNISINYTTESGNIINIDTHILASTKSYKWVIPLIDESRIKIKIYSDNNILSDISDDWLLIKSNDVPGTENLKKFPLDIGNIWYYDVQNLGSTVLVPYAVKKEIIDTTSDGYKVVKISEYYENDSIYTYQGYWLFMNGVFYKEKGTSFNNWEFSYDSNLQHNYFSQIGQTGSVSIKLGIDTVWNKITKSQVREDSYNYSFTNNYSSTNCNPYFLIVSESINYSTTTSPGNIRKINTITKLKGVDYNGKIFGDINISKN